MRPARNSIYLLSAVAGLYLLGCATLEAVPRKRVRHRPSLTSRRHHSKKPVHRMGPSGKSRPLVVNAEMLMVPPPPPMAHPRKLPILGYQKGSKPFTRPSVHSLPAGPQKPGGDEESERNNNQTAQPEGLNVRDSQQSLVFSEGLSALPASSRKTNPGAANHYAPAIMKPAPVAQSSPVLYAALEIGPPANHDSNAPDPEELRIGQELRRLRDDTHARRAFYDDLRRSVEQARSGKSTEDLSQLRAGMNVAGGAYRNRGSAASIFDRQQGKVGDRRSPFHPVSMQYGDQRLPLRKTAVTDRPPADAGPKAGDSSFRDGAGAAEPSTLDAELSKETEITDEADPRVGPTRSEPTGGGIEPASYQMVVRWAKANGTPVELALGVAWMESRLNPHPARGAAGEVGMFQIMPSRCSLEGWPPERLNDPEFNARLGTLLLARYYQEEGSVARAAAKYVAGPGVFNKHYASDVWSYINWYASSVDSYANYFSRYQG